MPVEFLSDEQASAFGCFVGVPSRAELERFFFLDDADRRLVDRRVSDQNRLGFAVQLGTVRFIGVFLQDPLDVPSEVVSCVHRPVRKVPSARRLRIRSLRPKRSARLRVHGDRHAYLWKMTSGGIIDRVIA